MIHSSRVNPGVTGAGSAASGKQWLFRGTLALTATILGLTSAGGSFANVLAKGDPGRAYALAPGNGTVAARYAQDLFSARPDTDPQGKAAKIARQALLDDPTAADALTVLAFQAQLRGERDKADNIFRYSTALSRRELRPRLWAIEEAVNRGDIDGALRHYDVALRTSRDAGPMLYPTLGAAMAEPRIRAGFLAVLATNPGWKDEFFDHVARRRISPEGLAALLVEGRSIDLKVTEDARVQIIDALIISGKTDQAWSLYREMRKGASRDQSRDPNFALDAASRSAFDWRAGEDSRLGAAILKDGAAGAIDFAAPPDSSGVLAQQSQLLAPGRYRLHGRSRGIDQSASALPYWTLVCANGRELGRIQVPNSATSGGRFSGSFRVPQGCVVQHLQLVARPSSNVMGLSGQILEVRLKVAP